MPPITSSGIGSGLDVNGLVSQLLTLERQPIVALERKEATYQAELSAYGSLKSALSGFQTTVRGLSSLARFQAVKASVADTGILGAGASSTALPGSYSIEVKQLAQTHKLASAAFTNTTDSIGTGTLTIQFGSVSGGVFTANGAKPVKTVSVDSAHSSLSGVQDAINAAQIGVSASILNDGTGYKLVLTSQDSGAANSLKITVSDGSDASHTDNAGLSRLAYDPAGSAGNGKNLTETVAAQNALLKVDGIDNIAKASNTVTDLIPGVTLSLFKPSAANTPTTLTVARDGEGVRKGVEDFVKAYNDLQKSVKDLTAYDAATRRGAILQGDSSALSILSQVRRILNSTITGLSGGYTALSQIGVSFQKDGTLALDASKLQTAVNGNFNDIAGLFAAQGRTSDSLVSYIGSTDKTQPGGYALSVSQLATQGYLNGAASAALADTAGTFTAPFTVVANNDSFAIKLDGVQSGIVTLAQGSYTTAAALTAEIQSKINGDSALVAAAAGIAVTFDSSNDRLVITSTRYGSASLVEVTSVDSASAATLGLSAASGTAGVDAAGTINGAAATGSGRFLTAPAGHAAEGLKLEITGGAIGNRGSVNFSQGYAYRLDKLADQLLGSSGPITSRTSGINERIKGIDKRRETLNQRLEDVEKRLRAQFAALDSLVGRLRTTSDYLSRQLATLPGASTQAQR